MGGAAVPLLAVINASYGQAIGHVLFAAMTLSLVASATLVALVIIAGGTLPTMETIKTIPLWQFTAGLFFVVYVVCITAAAPRIGLGNAIILVVVAQILVAATIDHFGLFGTAVQHITWPRTAGIVCLCIGVFLARS